MSKCITCSEPSRRCEYTFDVGCKAYTPALLYVAGAYSADTTMGVAWNVSKANAAADLLAALGFYPLVPHQLGQGFDPMSTKHGADYWYALTLEVMRRCDAVVLLPGWERSRGSVAEREEALRLGKPVYELADLCEVPEVLL